MKREMQEKYHMMFNRSGVQAEIKLNKSQKDSLVEEEVV